jgi:hypothetical protein
VGNSQRVKDIGCESLVSQRRKMDAIAIVVDRRATVQPPEKRHGTEICCREGEYDGAGLLQCRESLGVPGHHGVDIVAQ